MHTWDKWGLFIDNWFMSLTMIFGSFVAGISSEGGGAIAYPVMTLMFKITPDVARNFSLAIQSIGMTAASLWIFAKRIPVERTYLLLSGLGGLLGVIAGTIWIAPIVPPAYAKMMFVSFWLSFGIALFVINHIRKRDTRSSLPVLSGYQKTELVLVGLLGGVLSAVFGNGIDICTFSFVTMKYSLSEKIATPTSVVLMTTNAIVGTLMHGFVVADMQVEAINYWLVCIPFVILGAPLGANVLGKINRISIAVMLYLIIIAQFVAALFIIQPSGMLMIVSMLTFLTGIAIFFFLTSSHEKLRREIIVDE
ncbi:sulfite exporter TauE/SafE family protein [Fodinibius salsisoli]|uniref:Probable membrane transporter protein n=1 Tax=Fodinibius salsisoli TaxID=2820877 RepID=A0ABT3PJ97_9BACT|nr:sulfite exporter TauE/SafE family protein [Fodinibius salsisoli]MCW9706012.1 sulfite exporter TauE/SafE family protein [Fodinibius salsisoli]